MQLTYDPEVNVAYLKLKDQVSEVQTLHLSEELNVDIASDGTVYGIEFLNAKEQLNVRPHDLIRVLGKAS